MRTLLNQQKWIDFKDCVNVLKVLIFTVFCLIYIDCNAQADQHLFILSGQSNMVGLKPEESFKPLLEASYGKGKVLVVKDAMGSQPIRRWVKQQDVDSAGQNQGDLYDSLMTKVWKVTTMDRIKTVTFVWMQGERDARESLAEKYEKSLLELYQKLSEDLKRTDVNFIIGRLNDFDMENKTYPHWTKIREIQQKTGASNDRFAWVNTDDLNDGFDRNGNAIHNDLHMSKDGYTILGERFAKEAIKLINNH